MFPFFQLKFNFQRILKVKLRLLNLSSRHSLPLVDIACQGFTEKVTFRKEAYNLLVIRTAEVNY